MCAIGESEQQRQSAGICSCESNARWKDYIGLNKQERVALGEMGHAASSANIAAMRSRRTTKNIVFHYMLKIRGKTKIYSDRMLQTEVQKLHYTAHGLNSAPKPYGTGSRFLQEIIMVQGMVAHVDDRPKFSKHEKQHLILMAFATNIYRRTGTQTTTKALTFAVALLSRVTRAFDSHARPEVLHAGSKAFDAILSFTPDPSLTEVAQKNKTNSGLPVSCSKQILSRAFKSERLARSPPTKANRAQSPAGSPDFRKWESCRTMPLVGGFSRRYPVSPTPPFRRRSKFSSITPIGSQDLAVKSRPNLFTHSLSADQKTRPAVKPHVDVKPEGAKIAQLQVWVPGWIVERGGYSTWVATEYNRPLKKKKAVITQHSTRACQLRPLSFACEVSLLRGATIHSPSPPPSPLAGDPRSRYRATETYLRGPATQTILQYSALETPNTRTFFPTSKTRLYRGTVVERFACSPLTKAIRVQSPAGSLRIFTCGNRAGRCRWSAGLLGDFQFPPPFHSSAAPQSPTSALKTSMLRAAQMYSHTGI
ncbi:hypothetical protein PR048_000760 [Dryococelus australis]|uniref:Uncharacterized protein n=1 Tax=Dryococelus australis TaxID=614101 RepID=A0ABQ9IFH8_9NEOP|nr:hypothetical protein PR048_000760 [Dryococelus australis]